MLGEAGTQARAVHTGATATHPREVEAGVSPMGVEAGDSPMEVEDGGSHTVVEAGGSPMVVEAGVKVLAPITNGISPVSPRLT